MVSLIVYSALGLIKLTTLLNSIVIGFGGLYAGLIITTGLSANIVFPLAILLRSITAVLVFWNITSDKIEALAHAIFDPIWNIVIYVPIFLMIYNLFN